MVAQPRRRRHNIVSTARHSRSVPWGSVPILDPRERRRPSASVGQRRGMRRHGRYCTDVDASSETQMQIDYRGGQDGMGRDGMGEEGIDGMGWERKGRDRTGQDLARLGMGRAH